MNNIRIVPMTADHLDALEQLERTCFSRPWSRKMLAEELDNQCAAFLVAEDAATGQVIGYAGLLVAADEGYITNVAVFPQYRRRGYGQELETFILNQVVAAGERPYCQIFEGNAASLALQAKLGWLLAEKPICWLFPPEG